MCQRVQIIGISFDLKMNFRLLTHLCSCNFQCCCPPLSQCVHKCLYTYSFRVNKSTRTITNGMWTNVPMSIDKIIFPMWEEIGAHKRIMHSCELSKWFRLCSLSLKLSFLQNTHGSSCISFNSCLYFFTNIHQMQLRLLFEVH